MKVEGPTHHAQHLGAHIHDVLGGVVPRKRDLGVLLERFPPRPDLHVPVYDDPIALEFEVLAREDQLPVDLKTVEMGRRHVEQHLGPVAMFTTDPSLGRAPPHVVGADQRRTSFELRDVTAADAAGGATSDPVRIAADMNTIRARFGKVLSSLSN